MNALVIVAHGSRKKESALEVAALCKKLSDKNRSNKTQFDIVAYAFLQFAAPSLEATIEDLVQKGARRIVVFPFFIAAGSHLLMDIPTAVEQAGKAHTGVDFSITRHLGGMAAIEDIILCEVETHLDAQAEK